MKKTIVIIGGTGGVGHAAAIALAKQGNDIIIQGRDAEKGKKIVSELGGSAKFIAADISSVDGIKNLAAEIKKLTNKIDILIHSTGTLNSERRESKDGLDESFTVNYLTKFILDNLLLEELKRADGKVIVIGAPLMKSAAINFDDLQMKTNYSLMKSMGQAMLGVHMHAEEFAKRNGNIPINIINPGLVKSGILRNTKGPMKIFFNIFGPMINISADKAVINIMDVANNANSKDSGYFYPKVAKSSVKQKIDLDKATAAKLWDESLKIAKL